MASQTFDADGFAAALDAFVPEVVAPLASEIYFGAALDLHGALVRLTPVDTGYLRAGCQATPSGEAPTDLEPRHAGKDYSGQSKASESLASIGKAAASLEQLMMGYVAEYAPYVNEKRHMLEDAAGQWPSIVDRQVAQAKQRGAG